MVDPNKTKLILAILKTLGKAVVVGLVCGFLLRFIDE